MQLRPNEIDKLVKRYHDVYTKCICHPMERTQVYLTTEQRGELKKLAARSGKRQSELIREAIDALVADAGRSSWKSDLMAAAGLWANRDDLPDFARLRSEFDRCNPPDA